MYQSAAAALDAADGVMDGRFFGSKILGEGNLPGPGYAGAGNLSIASGANLPYAGAMFGAAPAPVYKTPYIGGYGLGMTGAVGGITSGAYPSFGMYGAQGYSSLPVTSVAAPAAVSAYPNVAMSVTRPIQTQFAAPQFAATQLAGSQFAASQYAAPQFAAPQFAATQFAAPQFAANQYAAPQFAATQFAAPQFAATQFAAPQFAATQYLPPQVVQAPPQMQYIEAPPQYIEPAACAPCAQYVEAPPVVLQLPAPMPPAPAQLPPPPSVIHIKDDSGPKIASLQAEIRRLERLLAAAKETEGGMRAEMAELQTRLEVLHQKEAQHAACEAEVARLREQLLEAQRRLVFLEGQRDEAHKHIAFLENQLKAADAQIAQMAARIRQMEQEISSLRTRLETKQEVHSRTNVHETYKVKSFEIAAKLAVMDGTDDGMYNGLPIEVEGEGLYKDLVAMGRRARENVSLTGRPASVTTTSETYKVQTFEMAEKLSKMDGTNDGKYNGLPIEVVGEGLYNELVRHGRRSAGASGGALSPTMVTSMGSASGGQTYKVSNMEMAAKISKMGGADDGTYKGLPIEISGMGLYRDLRGRM